MQRITKHFWGIVTALMMTVPTLAQEAAADTPQGLGWLFFLMGLGMVFIVGFVITQQDKAEQEGEQTS